MAAEVVPIGKYKGEPVEVLLADQDYTRWLLAQPWLAERYATFHQTVINYGAEPQDSPEHNEMQLAYLNDKACVRLMAALFPDVPTWGEVIRREFEVDGWDLRLTVEALDVPYEIQGKDGWEKRIGNEHLSAEVEFKPDMGDDFPAVLRQVKARRPSPGWRRAVVVRKAEFRGVDWAQVVEMFRLSGFKLVAEPFTDREA